MNPVTGLFGQYCGYNGTDSGHLAYHTACWAGRYDEKQVYNKYALFMDMQKDIITGRLRPVSDLAEPEYNRAWGLVGRDVPLGACIIMQSNRQL